MTSTTQQPVNVDAQCTSFGATIPFEAISQCGAYICNWSGHLCRVPEDGVAQGRSPLINFVGSEPLTVTKISDNPYVSITMAMMLACNCEVHVNF